MTAAEIETAKKRAEALVKSVGGALAAILGLRATDKPIKWNPKTGKFMIGRQAISVDTIRRELHRFEVFVGVRMSKTADLLFNGTIDLAEWQAEMKQIVGASHIATAAVAAGSIADAADDIVVQKQVVKEQKFVERFAKEIRTKKLKKPTVKARAKSYLLAAAVTFAVVEHALFKTLGYTQARRIRTARESCRECRAVSGEWMDIDEMPAIGSLTCGSRCRCYLIYR